MMNVQIFGTPKCRDTQKALRFFKERGINPHFVNLIEKNISKGELNNICKKVPIEELIDKKGKEFKKQQLEYKIYDIETEILNNSLLLRTPIVRFENSVTIGLNEDDWKTWLKKREKL